MKNVLNINLGSRNFIIDDDAYARLSEYLKHFRTRLGSSPDGVPFIQATEVMEDLESRISDLFYQEIGSSYRVVNLYLVQRVISQLGMPDGKAEGGNEETGGGAGYGSQTGGAGGFNFGSRTNDTRRSSGSSSGCCGQGDGAREGKGGNAYETPRDGRPQGKKIYRDMDNAYIAGVCSGLSIYLDIDVVLVRIIMLVALIAGSIGFWLYLIMWIAVPKAVTAAQKCEMYGLPVTAENMAHFSQRK